MMAAPVEPGSRALFATRRYGTRIKAPTDGCRHDAAQGRAARRQSHGRCVGGQVRRLTQIGLTPSRPLEETDRAAFSWPSLGRQKWREGGRRNEMAINLDYDIDLQ